ncbi:MAG TPA: Rne/Rng family ribonuclease [Acidobacteriaceae bacterium]|nr:Rne/Rng family ribonuclease [Acidobacteriaceae bacterium]
MSKEIYISSTPHETRLAIVEEDNLAEIYYERENEYTLAGSIYNGRVTRVLPGMQSAFVDIGLERDAFLYITDFLEEAPDSEEFDTAPAANRNGERSENAPRGDRGGRGRRGGRDRNRGDRNGDTAPADQTASDSDFAAPQYDDAGASDLQLTDGEGPAAVSTEDTSEGGRRWRGRRGRRRGRGLSNRPDQPTQDQGAEAAPESIAEPIADLDASAEGESFASMAGETERHGNERDRNRPRRGDRGRRFPRGFEPRRDRYGVSDDTAASGSAPIEGAYDAPPAGAEALVLPGESLARYRSPEETAALAASAPDAAPVSSAPSISSTTPLAPPATLYTLAEGWDGGDVLPGETIRRRGPESRPDAASGLRNDSPRRDRDRDRRGRRRGNERPSFSEPVAEASDVPAFDAAPVPEAEPAPVTEPPALQAPAPAIENEYEPTEASASYRVDPVPPSEFRQSTPVLEPEHEAPAETAAHDVTSISAAGEMHSEPVEEIVSAQPAHAAHPAPIEPAEPADPIRHEAAIVSSEPEFSAPGSYAPASGQLHEEFLDEEEPFTPTLHASSIEEMDDLDEETLEGAADLGTMLREMSIDQITRTEPEVEEQDADDEDDFEEDLLEEDEDADDEDDTETFQSVSGDGPSDAILSDSFERTEDADSSADSFGFESGEDAGITLAEGGAENLSGGPDPERRSRDFGREPDRRRGDRDRGRGRRGDRDRDRDRGRGRMGHGDRRSRASAQTTNLPAISDLLKPGQEVLVQIAKEPIAKKGARITSHIALPGRFLVFMPTVNHTGVSRKIESDAERRRLKEILLSEKGDASGGFIVRTAAEGASEEELRSDLRFLLNLWSDIKNRSESSKSPALIYHDLNLVERILRDQVTDNFSAIWVDTESEYERVLRFLQRFQPSLIRRVKLYLKETPLFEQFGISEEINKALRSKVWLKSGGSIVINQTEALVAIDINTGKYVGKTARLEDTIVKTNLDAIPEIVRQIRLRDLGGIIIIDFIDMDERKNRNRVMAALEDELKNDRAPSKVLQFNDFGLVAITRKRVRQSLERTLSTTCSICTGTGMVKSPVTVCNDIYVEMRKMHKHLDRGDVMLRVHPDVVKQLKSSGSKWLQEMEEMAGKTILVKSDPSLHPEQFDIH